MAHYNTNLAAEFYVLSALYRLGIEANLTLGNRKAVDIYALNESGTPFTIDVKGLAGKTSWPIDNVRKTAPNHFLVFVCFLGTIEDVQTQPEVFVVPSLELEPLVYTAPGGRRLVQLRTLQKLSQTYENKWVLMRELGEEGVTIRE